MHVQWAIRAGPTGCIYAVYTSRSPHVHLCNDRSTSLGCMDGRPGVLGWRRSSCMFAHSPCACACAHVCVCVCCTQIPLQSKSRQSLVRLLPNWLPAMSQTSNVYLSYRLADDDESGSDGIEIGLDAAYSGKVRTEVLWCGCKQTSAATHHRKAHPLPFLPLDLCCRIPTFPL